MRDKCSPMVPRSLESLTNIHITLGLFLQYVLPTKDNNNSAVNGLNSIPSIETGIPKLLNSILVCLPNDSPSSPEDWRRLVFGNYRPSFVYEVEHEDVVLHAVDTVMRNDQKNNVKWIHQNILSRGFERRRREKDQGLVNNQNLHMKQTNAMVNFLLSRPWKELHKWCGTTIMIYLLTSTYMFYQIPNECWIQLTGQPLYCLMNRNNSSSSNSNSNSTNNNNGGKTTTSSNIAMNHLYRSPLQQPYGSKNIFKYLIQRNRIFYVRTKLNNDGLSIKHFISGINNSRFIDPSSKNTARRIALNGILCIQKKTLVKESSGEVTNNDNSSRYRKPRISKHYQPFVDIIHQLIQRHVSMDYRQNLERQCPPVSKIKENSSSTTILQQLIESNIPMIKVSKYIKLCCKQLIPIQSFGSKYNWRIFLSSIHQFIVLGRYETMSINNILEKLKLRDVPWYPSAGVGNHVYNKEMILRYIYWIYSMIIIPLIRNSFYATESQLQPNVVRYYRKRTWWSIEREGISNLSNIYQKLKKKDVHDQLKLKNNTSIGPYYTNVNTTNTDATTNTAGAVARAATGAGITTTTTTTTSTTSSAATTSSTSYTSTNLPSSLIDNQRKPLVTPIRFIPKIKTIRPISNLSIVLKNNKKSINSELNTTYQACKSISNSRPAINGCGVHGLDGIYIRLAPWLRNYKNSPNKKKIYIGKTDVSSCFDSILPNKLINILEDILQLNQRSKKKKNKNNQHMKGGGNVSHYSIGSSSSPSSPSSSSSSSSSSVSLKRKRIDSSLSSSSDDDGEEENFNYIVRKYSLIMADASRTSNVRAKFTSHATNESHFNDCFIRFAKSETLTNATSSSNKNSTNLSTKVIRNAIFTDHVHEKKTISNVDILNNIYKHIKLNIINMGGPNQYYKQRIGIPQGSILSTWLCNIYYGSMEKYLSITNQIPINMNNLCPEHSITTATCNTNDTVIARCTDDYLILSTSLLKTKQFINTMVRGIKEYNCNVAVHKTKTNFNMNNEKNNKEDNEGNNEENNIKYCGIIINSINGNISCDYSRYHKKHINTIVTIPPIMSGYDLKRLTRSFLKPRSHAILFDTTINSINHVKFNIYEIGRW
jgi:hypothetical protein